MTGMGSIPCRFFIFDVNLIGCFRSERGKLNVSTLFLEIFLLFKPQ